MQSLHNCISSRRFESEPHNAQHFPDGVMMIALSPKEIRTFEFSVKAKRLR